MRGADTSPAESVDSPGGGERPHRRISWAAVTLIVLTLAAVVVIGGVANADRREVAASPVASATDRATPSAASPEVTPNAASIPPGRDDIPLQPGTATEVIVIVDASEIDDATASGIRAGLVDFVQQLPEYDRLTLIAAGDNTRTVHGPTELDRAGRDAAIDSIGNFTFGGSRQLVRGVEIALAAAHDMGEGQYEALLIATGDDGSTSRELIDAGRLSEDGRGVTWLDLHAVAVGPGEHEAVLAGLRETYQWARAGGDVVRALTPYRLLVTEAKLLRIGVAPGDSEPIEVVVGVSRPAVRFTVHSPDRSLGIDAESPSGRRYDAASRGEDISVQELGGRVTVVVNGAEEGTWTLQLTGDADLPDGAWFEVEETSTVYEPPTTAYGTGDTTDDLRFGIAIGSAVDPPKASALVMAPDGSERSVELRPMEDDELSIGFVLTLGAIIDDPEIAGSYTIIIELDGRNRGGGVDSWMLGAYVAPERDTDGDGIRDSLELRHGLDPNDRSDGAADHDFDGLSTADELTIHGTNAGEWDTDGGRESDGSEVAAGRDPLDPSDDVPAVTCLELVPTPDPEASPSPTPAATPDPAPELEALLPDEVLGHATEKFSMTAPDRLDFIFGLFDAFLACTNTDRSDLSLAIAIAHGLQNWGVVAVEIDGVSGHEMEDIWLFRLSPGGPARRLSQHTVDGRDYIEMDGGWATYSTDETFYWVMNFTFGDDFSEPEATPEPIPEREEIIRAFIRLLPAD
jgi:hypothetical protein